MDTSGGPWQRSLSVESQKWLPLFLGEQGQRGRQPRVRACCFLVPVGSGTGSLAFLTPHPAVEERFCPPGSQNWMCVHEDSVRWCKDDHVTARETEASNAGRHTGVDSGGWLEGHKEHGLPSVLPPCCCARSMGESVRLPCSCPGPACFATAIAQAKTPVVPELTLGPGRHTLPGHTH